MNSRYKIINDLELVYGSIHGVGLGNAKEIVWDQEKYYIKIGGIRIE